MKSKSKIAVLGAGNGGYALASDLALAGFEINLFELEKFKKENLVPIQERGGIERAGIRPGFAKISMLTTDIEEAVKDVDVINITIPAYAHMTFIEEIAPHLDGKIVVFFPLNFADLKMRRYLKEKGMKKDVVIGGGETMPYACRRMLKPAYIFVRTSTAGMRVAALPAKDTSKLVDAIKLYPFPIVPANNTLEVSLAYSNPLGHIPMMLLNAASIERTRGDYNIFYTVSGVPPSQKKLEDKLNEERSAVCKGLGINDLLKTRGARAKAPVPPDLKAYWHMTETLDYRYLTEDVPYGLVTWSSLGDVVGVPTPTMKACIHLASVLLDTDYWKEGITADKLGLIGLRAIRRIAKH